MKKVPCDSADNFKSNLVHLALITIFATIPDDWISDEVYDNLKAGANKLSKELKPNMDELLEAIEAYNDMANDMTDKASDVLNKINEAVTSDGKAINLVSSHLAAFKNETILSQGCKIIDFVEAGLTNFTKSIDDSVDEFNAAMTLNQLKTINDTIVEITKLCNEESNGEETKLNTAELKKKIDDFTVVIKRETVDTPARFETAKSKLEKCVEEHIKTYNDSKSCAEEMFMESQLLKPIQGLLEVH